MPITSTPKLSQIRYGPETDAVKYAAAECQGYDSIVGNGIAVRRKVLPYYGCRYSNEKSDQSSQCWDAAVQTNLPEGDDDPKDDENDLESSC